MMVTAARVIAAGAGGPPPRVTRPAPTTSASRTTVITSPLAMPTGTAAQTTAAAADTINAGTGADAESAIPANATLFMTCVTSTAWKGYYMDADGDVAKVEAAAP